MRGGQAGLPAREARFPTRGTIARMFRPALFAMAKRWRRRTQVAAILGAITGVVILGRMWFVGRPFDAAAWQADANVGSGVRQAMADRLLARSALIGKTRSEVVALLGEPPETGYFRRWHVVYWLGPERGFFSIDSEWLVLRFGASGRVAEARLVTD